MTVILRYYQKETLDLTRENFENGIFSMVHCWPTGTGKSVGQNETVREEAPIETHRSILIGGLNRSLNEQAVEGFREQYQEAAGYVEINGKLVPGVGLVMGDINEPNARIVVASAQTIFPRDLDDRELPENRPILPEDVLMRPDGGIFLNPKSKRRWLISPRFDEILSFGYISLWQHDEAHHAPADGAAHVIGKLPDSFKPVKSAIPAGTPARKWYRQLDLIYLYLGLPPLKIVGWTATPIRNDGVAMSTVFEVMGKHLTDMEAVDRGFILPVAPAVLVKILDNVNSEFKLKVTENWEDRVIQAYWDHAASRACTAIFVGPINGMGSVQASKVLSARFNAAGISSVHIDALGWVDMDGTEKSNKSRKGLLKRIKRGEIKVVCNHNILIEGVDLPILDTIMLLRTVNEINFTQMMGRARRKYGNQTEALLVDFTGQELVMLLHGMMGGSKKNLFHLDETPSKVKSEGDKTGMSMRDMTPIGWIEGQDNSYSFREIQRKSRMMWYRASSGNSSMGVQRSEFGSDALLITMPHYTTADKYEVIMEREDITQKMRDTAAALWRFYNQFTLWHTRKNPDKSKGQSINGYWVGDHFVVGSNPVKTNDEIVQMGALDEVEFRASVFAQTFAHFDPSIASKKKKQWRKGSISEKQLPLFKALFPDLDPAEHSTGEASHRITHELSERAVMRMMNNGANWLNKELETYGHPVIIA